MDFPSHFNKQSSNQILLKYSITVVHKLLSLLKIEVGEDLQKTKYRTAKIAKKLLKNYCCGNS